MPAGSDAVPPCRRGLVSLLIALILIPHAAAVLADGEWWPWSSCAMFSRRLAPDQTRYAFAFIAETAAGERTVDPRAIGAGLTRGVRFFFSHVYGSCDPDCPQGAFPGDTPTAFAQRMARWHRAFGDALVARGVLDDAGFTALRCELLRIGSDGAIAERRPIGRYLRADDVFVHAPAVVPP